MRGKKIKKLSPYSWAIVALFCVFLLLRLFVASPQYLMGGDEPQYVALAKHAPYHTLFGDTLFLQHMPLFPWLIALFGALSGDLILGGLLVSLFASIATFFYLYRFGALFEKPRSWTLALLLFYTLSWNMVEFSRLIYKESFYIFLGVATLYHFISHLKKHGSIHLVWASIFGAAMALVTDQVMFLILYLALLTAWIVIVKHLRQRKISSLFHRGWIVILIIAIVYGSWIGVRFYTYANHDFIPVGTDGVIEDVRSFGMFQLISPYSFPESSKLQTFGLSIDVPRMASAVGYGFNMYPFVIPPNLNRSNWTVLLDPAVIMMMLLVYLPLLLLCVYGLVLLFRSPSQSASRTLYAPAIVCGLVFLIPLVSGVGVWRHIIFMNVFLFMLMGDGFVKLMKERSIIAFIIGIAIALLISWPIAHHQLNMSRDISVQAFAVAPFISSLPMDGVFVQTGYSMELAYLTDKRIYGLNADPTLVKTYAHILDIDYVVLGNKTWTPFPEPSIEYIKTHPTEYRLIYTIEEQYASGETTDVYTVYKIER